MANKGFELGNPLDASFYQEWIDGLDTTKIFALMLILSGLILGFVATTFQNSADVVSKVTIFFILWVIGMFLFTIDYLREDDRIFGFAAFGDTLTRMFIGVFAGGLLAFLLVSSNASIGGTVLVFKTPLIGSAVLGTNQLLNGFYTVIAAPFVEELCFRMALFFTLVKLFGMQGQENIMFAFIQGIAFAIFHGFVYSWSIPYMFAVFILALICWYLNALFKTSASGYMYHLTNNAVIFIRTVNGG